MLEYRIRSRPLLLLLVASLLVVDDTGLAQDLDPSEIFLASRDSVVLVMSFDRQGQPLAIGSGFFVGDGTRIATNLHVVEGADTLRIRSTSGDVQQIDTSLALDEEHDLILLSAPEKGAPLQLASSEPTVGQSIVAIGNPRGLEGTLSVGIISGIRKDGDSTYYQITAPISPGSSGGPIIDSSGDVLGVSTFYVDGGQNLNFAMPALYVARMLEEQKPVAFKTAVPPDSKKVAYSVDERVRVIEPYVDGMFGDLQASIVNGTDSTIRNIRLVAIYYASRSRSSDPLHYQLISVRDAIPAGLAKRFERRDSAVEQHGQGGLFDGKGRWRVQFRILDYEIEEGAADIPIFE